MFQTLWEHLEPLAAVAPKITYFGAVGSAVSGGVQEFAQQNPQIVRLVDPEVANFGVYFGAAIGVCGLVLQIANFVIRTRRARRDEVRDIKRHRAVLEALERGKDPLLPLEDDEK